LLALQAPRIGVVDFYGLRHVSGKRLREALTVREGDPLPASKGALEERLEHVGGVVRARLEAVCCEGDRAILYVGIEEKEAPHFEFKPEPSGDATLPEPVADSYRFLLAALERAARAGPVSENLLNGHALSSDPAVRAIQERLQYLAADHLDRIRRVLRESGDPSQRAAAAYVIGYAPTKRLVVEDLQSAMRDPDESVRANAIRSLAAIAALGARDKDLGIRVEPTWFIHMLNSLVWSDRTRAAAALVSLTEQRSPYVLDQIRETALPSLAEMARWKTLDHARPAFLVLGRVAGVPEAEIQAAWTRDNREAFIDRVLKSAP
jgi:HEAT repeat protein